MSVLRRIEESTLAANRRFRHEAVLFEAGRIVADVRERGDAAVLEHARRLGDLAPGDRVVYDAAACGAAFDALPPDARGVLERTAGRIRRFARAQRESMCEVTVDVPGGRAGHKLIPIERAGCYAPGGRFPLPSSVLMTAVTAREAGCRSVWVVSPRPSPVTLAAAAVAGGDGFLRLGGAQAVAAMAYGFGPMTPRDIVAGPGNVWVTAAKQVVSGEVGIDMLAGPTELVVVADGAADPDRVAADLIAQAEHDADAIPVLVTWAEELVETVEIRLRERLNHPATASAATAAFANGGAIVVCGAGEAIAVCNRIAPEHIQLCCDDAGCLAEKLTSYGSLFVGDLSAEPLGDYGAGPNHVLPTGGTARFTAGLSVRTFLRAPTWLEIRDAKSAAGLAADAAFLARLEGLEGHALSAEARLDGNDRESQSR